MSFAIVAAITAASTAVSVYGQVEAGKAQQEELERQAEEEKIAAQGRELQRREQLNAQLAANNAALASSGIATEGTPASIALESAKAISASEGMIGLSERLKRGQLRRQGKMERSTANIQAASTLLSGAGNAYGGFKAYNKKG
ncbi:MAG: hypothetical protein P8P29_02780 [Flavobacteriaceae bacterium]|nr:hypothetical protein [Flavobacteriaceae bacterium]